LSIVVVSLPAIVSQVVKTEVSLAGLIVVVPGAVGALSSTFIVARLMERRVRKRKLIWYSLLILSICLLIISTIVPNVYFWLGRLIAISCFFLAGGAYVVGIIPSLTFLQEVTPKDLMGRVFGNIWFVTTVATLLPVLFSATITEIFGIKLLLFILGIGGILVSLWFKKRQKYLII